MKSPRTKPQAPQADPQVRQQLRPPTRDASPRALRPPNPSPERPAGLLAVRELSEPRDPPECGVDSAMEEPIVTNDMDEAQSRQVALELQAPVSRRPVARPLLTPSVRDYGFQPRDPTETARQAASQLLNTYVIGPAARTPEGLAQRTALRERYLTPQVTSLSDTTLALSFGWRSLGDLVPWRLFELASQKWILV
ncbi:unnamed protein product [Phytophthora fragariaefolia]|uniref:Unnamed protein product n=1 Tax=Phytophthora fragariaefolia TaxID=1490495 RepID=A0A9W6YGD9_9STRA|nr:unnamed protein product [Phytophthora fragariaefolia]